MPLLAVAPVAHKTGPTPTHPRRIRIHLGIGAPFASFTDVHQSPINDSPSKPGEIRSSYGVAMGRGVGGAHTTGAAFINALVVTSPAIAGARGMNERYSNV